MSYKNCTNSVGLFSLCKIISICLCASDASKLTNIGWELLTILERVPKKTFLHCCTFSWLLTCSTFSAFWKMQVYYFTIRGKTAEKIPRMQFFDFFDCCPRQFGFKIRMLGSSSAVFVPPLCWHPARRAPGCSPAPTATRRLCGSSSPAVTPPPGAPPPAAAAAGSDPATPPPPATPRPTERQTNKHLLKLTREVKTWWSTSKEVECDHSVHSNAQQKHDKIKKKIQSHVCLKTFSAVANDKGNSTPMRWVENILTCQIPDSRFLWHRSSKLKRQKKTQKTKNRKESSSASQLYNGGGMRPFVQQRSPRSTETWATRTHIHTHKWRYMKVAVVESVPAGCGAARADPAAPGVRARRTGWISAPCFPDSRPPNAPPAPLLSWWAAAPAQEEKTFRLRTHRGLRATSYHNCPARIEIISVWFAVNEPTWKCWRDAVCTK